MPSGSVTTAVDDVRRQEHKAFQAEDDRRLQGTKYLWLWNAENIPAWRRAEFAALQAAAAQDQSGLGHQGGVAPVLALLVRQVGGEALRGLVLLGHALAARAP